MQITIAQHLLDAGSSCRSDEEIASFLKLAGLSKSVSVLAFSCIAGVPVSTAKLAIHFSKAWSGSRVDDERLHDDLTRALESPALRKHRAEVLIPPDSRELGHPG